VPSGIKSIAPIRRQPARGRLNPPASISPGTVAMISGQRLSNQAAGSTSQATSWAVRPLNWDEIIDEDDNDNNWADPGAPSGGWSRPSDCNDNDDSNGEEDTQGGEKGTGKGKGTKDGKGKGKGKATKEGKGKGNGNGKGKGIVKQTPGGDDISRAVAVQLQKEMYEADSDMEG